MALPEGWQMKKLGDILTPEQCEAVRSIINKSVGEHHLTKALRAYLESLRAELEAKEVDPGYLAYYLAYTVVEIRRTQGQGANQILNQIIGTSQFGAN